MFERHNNRQQFNDCLALRDASAVACRTPTREVDGTQRLHEEVKGGFFPYAGVATFHNANKQLQLT